MESFGRPTRNKNRIYKPDELSCIAEDQIRKVYLSFNAEEGVGGDVSQQCNATLFYGDLFWVEKETGADHGHAEMDALHKFWVGRYREDKEIFNSYSKKIVFQIVIDRNKQAG